MKKLSLLLICAMLASAPAAYAEKDINVYLNGSRLSFDRQPVIVNDRTYVPVRGIFEAIGMEVEWDDESKTAYAYGSGADIILPVNSGEMYVNGECIKLDNAPFIMDGRILVPLRAISESLGCTVGWDPESCSVTIIIGGTVLPRPTAQPSQPPEATAVPTAAPTAAPTSAPSVSPEATDIPAPEATPAPTQAPTSAPTAAPTERPTARPTAAPTQAPSSESAMEREVLSLVNSVRAENGLSALSWAEDLAAVARAHSADMISRGFFSHTNPDGLSPFDRLRNSGISYRTAAENIAYGQRSAEAVMNSWMNSSGHRANILNKNVTELGVGAVKSQNGTIYWTQMFIAR